MLILDKNYTFISTDIPNRIIQDLEPIRNNDEAEFVTMVLNGPFIFCRQLMQSGRTPGLHVPN
ncbi:hypothetical protein DERP_015318 [Dermatophagoides pteronyssinus]|uniref:Uncharacterized protein n=1 Tax=Dermatophagoides pteronyssinus TaxID=6956 RepID=A0ABQ8JTN5_DERPT|nr:hypothetical protein DERP_015318 [Dermatophagoides pteronyssinus]